MPGYFAEIVWSILLLFAYMMVNGVTLLTFISFCLHHRAFYQLIKHSMDQLKQPSDNEVADDNRCDEKFLRDSIEFHMSIKE